MSNRTGQRPLRADAARNRQRLIDAARDAFASGNETVTLEDIARAAGVGIGTLYRNFRTREALVEAVYRSELDAVARAADVLLANHPGFDALRLWMDCYATFVATKRGMHEVLRGAWASGRLRVSETRARITATIARILAAGAADGTLRDDVEPDDVTATLVGVFLATTGAADRAQLQRVLDLLMDALRPRTRPGSRSGG